MFNNLYLMKYLEKTTLVRWLLESLKSGKLQTCRNHLLLYLVAQFPKIFLLSKGFSLHHYLGLSLANNLLHTREAASEYFGRLLCISPINVSASYKRKQMKEQIWGKLTKDESANKSASAIIKEGDDMTFQIHIFHLNTRLREKQIFIWGCKGSLSE